MTRKLPFQIGLYVLLAVLILILATCISKTGEAGDEARVNFSVQKGDSTLILNTSTTMHVKDSSSLKEILLSIVDAQTVPEEKIRLAEKYEEILGTSFDKDLTTKTLSIFEGDWFMEGETFSDTITVTAENSNFYKPNLLLVSYKEKAIYFNLGKEISGTFDDEKVKITKVEPLTNTLSEGEQQK